MKINYHLLNDTLILQFDGRHEAVRKGDARFNALVDAIKKNELDKIPEIMEHNLFKGFKEFEYDKTNDILYYQKKPLPLALKAISFPSGLHWGRRQTASRNVSCSISPPWIDETNIFRRWLNASFCPSGEILGHEKLEVPFVSFLVLIEWVSSFASRLTSHKFEKGKYWV